MASWNSVPLLVLYEVFGWLTFVCWSFSFYPQVMLNYRRKSVVGLNFDFVVLNLTKHSSYLFYNASLYFSPSVQKQYKDKFGENEMIPVGVNDVAFSSHAVLLSAITLFQIAIYERGDQKVSKIACGIVSIVWLIIAICFFRTLSTQHWLWLLNVFKYVVLSKQIFPLFELTLLDISLLLLILISYMKGQCCPVLSSLFVRSGAFMNFMRKSTEGWSIENILLDFSGSVGNYAQMIMQSIDQGSWMNFYGNIGKVMLSLVSISFDILFIIQHYVLYRHQKGQNAKTDDEVEMAKSIDKPVKLLLKEVEIEETEKMPLVP